MITLTNKAHFIYHRFCKPGAVDTRAAEEAGMLPKSALKDGASYRGHCRNTCTAKWDAVKEVFYFDRYKFGSVYEDHVEHPVDDKGFDVFVPVEEL